jgi:uncharacterized protein (TIGR03435 family)
MLLVVVAGALLPAQEPAFDVASVKVTDSAGAGWTTTRPGEVRFDGGPLRIIIPVALEVPIPLMELRVMWSASARELYHQPLFEIHGKGDPANDQLAMLRTLLRERFGLKWHTEVRQIPLYALRLKEPGKVGPWLTPTPHNCREFIARGGKLHDADSPRKGDKQICWPTVGGRVQRNGEDVNMGAGTIQDLIERVALGGVEGERPVIDATGLSGNFLWEVTKTRGPAAIFPVFEDELGLTFERRVGPWEVIVIDEVKMPTPN